MIQVAIQGVEGCFHEVAARNYFADEEVQSVECATFDDLFERVEADKSLCGIVAIENTIAGSLLQNHELLRESNLAVVGEYKLRISHVLCALPGDTMESIREVHSHPIALMQCGDFLKRHPSFKVVERDDTAGSAREIAERGLHGHAAICSARAARRYGMEILEESIETNKHNFTRFLIVADPWIADDLRERSKMNKANIVFSLPHNEGSLSQVLSIFSFYKINLTKIQSLPIIGREWEYLFYVDVIFNDYLRFRQSIDAVSPLTKELKVLGEYEEGKSSI